MEKIGDYIVERELGCGESGTVYECHNEKTNEKVAIKSIKKASFIHRSFGKRINREIALLSILKHPNIQNLYEVLESSSHFFLVLEFAEKGTMFEELKCKHKLDELTAAKYFRQLIYGVEYIHSFNICHRDIKAENILLTSTNDLKLSDFGFAKYLKAEITNTACGSPHYTAPEVLSGSKYDAKLADIWSCGVNLYAFLVGYLPFDSENYSKLLSIIKRGHFSIPPTVSAQACDLIRRIIDVNPERRMRIEQIKKHPFFRLGLKDDFILPEPLHLCNDNEPILLSTIPERIRKTLTSIGFTNDDELRDEIETEFSTRVKKLVSHLMRTSSFAELPWKVPLNAGDDNDLLRSHAINSSDDYENMMYKVQSLCRRMDLEFVFLDQSFLVAKFESLFLVVFSYDIKEKILSIHQYIGTREKFEELIIELEKISSLES